MSRYNRCKECYNMDCIFVTGEREDIDTSECADYRPMTNADRIRSMTDEELMRLLLGVRFGNRPWCDDEPCNERYCSDCITEWLKEEVQYE